MALAFLAFVGAAVPADGEASPAAILCGLGAEGPGAPCTLWSRRADRVAEPIEPASQILRLPRVAAAPDASRVFVTGILARGLPTESNFFDILTLAYDGATGAELWRQAYDGPAGMADQAAGLVLSPDGERVFVTGHSRGVDTGLDYVTLAYEAATGAPLWTARLDGPAHGGDVATSLGGSADGATVFVTGASRGVGTFGDLATVAYDAATGAERWVARFNGPGNLNDGVTDTARLVVAGDWVIVTGACEVDHVRESRDVYTLGYAAETGELRWVDVWAGSGLDADEPAGTAAAGGRVFVAATSDEGPRRNDIVLLAFDPATGARAWTAVLDGGLSAEDFAAAVAVSPDADRVFVTGRSAPVAPGPFSLALPDDMWTVALEAATGTLAWESRYRGPAGREDFGLGVAVSGDGQSVVAVGRSQGVGWDFATVAHDAADGRVDWLARYHGARLPDDALPPPAGSPTGASGLDEILEVGDQAGSVSLAFDGRAFVTGVTAGGADLGYATLAYAARGPG